MTDIQAGIIVDVESSMTMMQRVEDRFNLKPSTCMCDTAYGPAKMLGSLVEEKQISARVPVHDKSERKATLFGQSDFTWKRAQHRYQCADGHFLDRNL